MARRKAEEELVTGPMASHRPDTATEPEIGVGDFVGLMAKSSTLQKPLIFLGVCSSYPPKDQVLLLWYRHTRRF